MISNLIVHKGEMYHIVGEAIAQTMDDNREEMYIPIVRIEKVEAFKKSTSKDSFWLPLAKCKNLPSSIDYQVTEWSLGLMIGLQNGSQNY